MANFYKIKYSGKQLEELLDQIYDIPYSSGDGIILAETQIQANVTTVLYSDGLYYWYINGDKTNIVNPDGEGATAPTATIGENGFWYLNGQQTNLLVPSGKSISLDPNYAKFTNYLTTEKVNEQLEPILTDIANLKVTKQDSLIAGDWITIQNNTISTTVDIPTQISDLPNDANYVNLNEVKNYVDPIDEALHSDIASHGTRLSTLENAIQNKVDKVDGKGLSTNDFTTEYKTQLDDLSTTYATKQDLTDIINGAPEEYDTLKEIAEWIKSDESGSAAMTSDIATLKSYFTNGSANKALADQSGNNIETTYTKISDFNALSAEVETKQDTLVSGTNIKTVNGQSILGSGNIEISGGGGKLEGFTIDVSGTYNSETKNFTGTLTDEQWTKVQNEQIYWIEVVYINNHNQETGEETTASTTLLYSGPFFGVGRAFIDSNGSMMIIFDKSISGMIANIVLKMDAQNKPTSQLIPSITTSNTQQNLTIGNGLTIENGVLKTTGGGESATKMVMLGTLSNSGTLEADKLQELFTLLENGQNIQAAFGYGEAEFITANAYSNGSLMGIVAYDVSNSLNAVNLSINPEDGNYTITTIEISGGSATKMVNLGTLSQSGTLDADKLQELITLFQNGDLIQATFVFSESQFITASAYSIGSSSMGIVAHAVLADFGSAVVVDLSINTANGNYAITPIELPLRFKTINGKDITGSGNIEVQKPLVSGTNIKTINNTSLLTSGNINLQEPLVSGTNIKTVNGQTILGNGDLEITTDITYATDNEVNALFTSSGQPIPDKTISLENLNAFKQQIDNEIGKVLEEGF